MKQQPTRGHVWYKREQWDRMRSVSSDRDDMEEKYDDWERKALKEVDKLRRQGIDVQRTEIDVDALVAWAARKGLDINGDTRADFATHVFAASLGLDADL